MHIIKIVKNTVVDGPGFRTSIYTSGCPHHCKNCHNPSSWDINYGEYKSVEDIINSVNDISSNQGITLTGGDPLYQIEESIDICKILKEQGRNIWIYTGYVMETIMSSDKLKQILPYIDVIVDGKYVDGENCINDNKFIFRGSRNQRLVDVKQSILKGRVVEYEYNPYPIF